MWLCMNNGFISIVQDRNCADRLVVRSRRREILEMTFPTRAITVGGGTDYKYRVFVSKLEVAITLLDRILEIDYGNFKASVTEPELYGIYAKFWKLHSAYQR